MNQKELETFIIEELNRAIKDAGESIADELSDKLGAEGRYYSRTDDVIRAFLNPPKVKIVNRQIVGKLFDNDLISMSPSSVGEKPLYHRANSFGNKKGATSWRGFPYSYLIVDWLEYGFTLPSKKKYEGLHYIENVLEASTDNYFEEVMAQAIIKYTNEITKRLKGGF